MSRVHPIFEKLLEQFAPKADATAPFADRIAAADRGKVKLRYVYPPIPIRDFDWCATFDDDEPNDNGQMLHGYGKTEAEAIEELLTNYEDGL